MNTPNAGQNAYIRKSTTAGNGLHASRDLPGGSVALEITRPLVIALDGKRLNDTCAHCLAWAAGSDVVGRGDTSGIVNLKTCLGCGIVRYCSKTCQSASWMSTHKAECKIYKSVSSKGPLPNAARAMLQMLQSLFDWTKSPFRDMKSHLQEITERGGERAETLQVLSTGIHHYSGTKHSMEIVRNCFALVLTNSLTLWTPTFDPLGICVDPIAASANHSCEPNVITVFDGPRLQFRTLKPISKDEEIFISYIDSTDPFHKRQADLKGRFYFECRCPKCQKEDQSAENHFLRPPNQGDVSAFEDSVAELTKDKSPLATIVREARSSYQTYAITTVSEEEKSVYASLATIERAGYLCLKQVQPSDPQASLKLLEDALTLCDTDGLWPQRRQPLPAILQEYFVMLLTAGEYWKAFIQGLKLYLNVHPILYSQTFNPVRVVHKWTMAKLALYLSSQQDGPHHSKHAEAGLDYGVIVYGLLMEVVDNVRLSHGDSSFARMVQRKSEEVKVDMTRGDVNSLRSMTGQIDAQWTKLRQLTAGTPAS